MNDKFVLNDSNIVILAKNYNPSIASKEWLRDKKIILEDVTNFIHTPVLSVVETLHFTFVLDQNRLQISVKNGQTPEVLPKMALIFVTLLPETPYAALGFNYIFRVPLKNSGLNKLLLPKDDKLKNIFSDDYKIGLIASFMFEGFAVMVNFPPPVQKTDQIDVSINFHSEKCDIKEITKRLTLFKRAMYKANSVLRGLVK